MRFPVSIDTQISTAIILGCDPRVTSKSELTIGSGVPSLNLEQQSLRWIPGMLAELSCCRVIYVGGGKTHEAQGKCSDLQYYYFDDKGSGGDLLKLIEIEELVKGNVLICRSNVLFTSDVIQNFFASSNSVVYGTSATLSWGEIGRRKEDNPRNGSVKCGIHLLGIHEGWIGEMFLIAKDLFQESPQANLEDWILHARNHEIPTMSIDLSGQMYSIGEPGSVAKCVLGTKGQTLARLQDKLQTSTIVDQIRFSVIDWHESRENILQKISDHFGPETIIVRSSSQGEDQWDSSQAGVLESVLDVNAGNPQHISHAIERVIESFERNGLSLSRQEEILVQPQIMNIRASGVLLTRELETGAPYYIVNIEESSGRSDTVTAGRSGEITKIVVHRDVTNLFPHPDIKQLVVMAREIEDLVQHDALNIEFAFNQENILYVLQVRPLVLSDRRTQSIQQDSQVRGQIEGVRNFVTGLMKPQQYALGQTTLLGTMPDWNPAEMIGTIPRPLALSLYQRLIGDQVWAAARASLGYRDVRPLPLILSLAGRPYVDIRGSLNSFLPNSLDSSLGTKLIDVQIERLRQHPELHDKIEFELACPSFDLTFTDHAARMVADGYPKRWIPRFQKSLLQLTDSLLCSGHGIIAEQLHLIDQLSERRNTYMDLFRGSDWNGGVRVLSFLMEDCKRLGTFPFSILARFAFMSLSLLRSLMVRGIFSLDEFEGILKSLHTVAGDFVSELSAFSQGQHSREELLEKYGHLRPSSYDITSPNYSSAPELMFSQPSDFVPSSLHHKGKSETHYTAHEIFASKREKINRILRQEGFSARCHDLEGFVIGSIPGREKAKFEFSKNLNWTLENLAALGQAIGFSRQEISFLSIDQILRGATDSMPGNLQSRLTTQIEQGQSDWEMTRSIQLPFLIRDPQEIDVFEVKESIPNFITSKSVTAPILEIDTVQPDSRLMGKLAIIPSADPGYDWVFRHQIAGLITQFGGAASHMAIRAAEFGIPAAIGCGELIYQRIVHARMVLLDCGAQQVRVIR
ncbi:MAG: PEP/pyruvate-binding domain-containing protein [Nitrospirales bacterium]